ncbi:MAG: sugar phosphate nucleotidyltransferase, partial [Candidatus Omnitrophica bacterium]|nr:sugar phosphate nucleotidyltransferase [Candidatus Omnitrophota bacterium]
TLGAAIVGARSSKAVMAVLPADHLVSEADKFSRVLEDAFELAGRRRVIVTIGIKPVEPHTGYGYIRIGQPLPPPPDVTGCSTAFFKADQFVEKPSPDLAVEYLNSGRYFWNSGMFIWSFESFIGELERHQPNMADACRRWSQVAGTARFKPLLAVDYAALERLSIDYALMEKSKEIVVAQGTFAWDDLGSWTA